MSPPNKISGVSNKYYDEQAGICREPEPLACLPDSHPSFKNIPDEFVYISPAQVNVLASVGSRLGSSTWSASPLLLMPITLPIAAAACSFDTEGTGTGGGRPIADIQAITEESELNSDPIVGRLRQVALDISPESKGVMAWSVLDFDNPEAHGVYSRVSEDSTLKLMKRIAPAVGNIPRDTSAAVLSNGESVVVYSQIQGDNAPSSLTAQRLNANGDPTGEVIEILPETIRTGFPQGQVIASEDGFIVVFRDGEGKLQMASYNLSGIEQERKELGTEPLNFQIVAGGGGDWALATLGDQQVQVRMFRSGASEVSTDVETLPIANSSDLSLAMQDDGSVMVVWNALSGTDSVLEGAWLGPDGAQVGDNQILRNLVRGTGFDNLDHVNSHSLTTDHRGNFILAYEENRSIFARVYSGTVRDDHALTDIASFSQDETGPYGDFLAGLDNVSVQNVDVGVDASEDGLLSFVFTKIFSGTDSATGETLTANKIVRRDYQISYE